MVRRSLPPALATAALFALLPAAARAATDKDVNVVNTPGVNVLNTPSVAVANVPGVTVTNTPSVQLAPGGAVAATQAGAWSVSVLPTQPVARGVLTLGAGTSSAIGPAPITAASLALVNPVSAASGGGAGAGKVSFRELVVTRTLDASSPALFLATAEGRVFPTGSVVLSDGNGTTVLRFDLQDVVVSSLATGSDGTQQPLETVGLTFSRIVEQTGGSSAGWDVLANQRF